MMESKTLHSIREAEKRAAALLEQAERERGAIISKARAKASSIISAAESESAKKAARLLEKERERIYAERERLRRASEEAAGKLLRSSSQRAEKAADMVFSAFMEEADRC